MDTILYNSEHNSFRVSLREYLREHVQPFVVQWEKEGVIPRRVWKQMGRRKFLCPTVSRENGGIGGDFLHAVILAEEVTRTNHWGLAVNHHSDITKLYIEKYASAQVKEKYLPQCISGDIINAMATTEPNCGSDLFALQTRAQEVGKEIVINGSKAFISNGYASDLVVVLAKERMEAEPEDAFSLFLVPTDVPGFKRSNPLKKMGWRSQDTAELFFTNCRIPMENRIGRKGSGLSIFMENIQAERLIMAVMAVTLAEMIFKEAVNHFRERNISINKKNISQATRFDLVEMATELKLGRIFVNDLISENMKGRNVLSEITMAKCWTTDMCNKVASTCLDIVGEEGLEDNSSFSRAYRDARVLKIAGGSTETLKDALADMIGLKRPTANLGYSGSPNDRTKYPVKKSPDRRLGKPVSADAPADVVDVVRTIASALIKHDSFTIQDRLIDIGFNSLLMVNLVWQIREKYPVQITVVDVFEAATIQALADKIVALNGNLNKQQELKLPRIKSYEIDVHSEVGQ